MKYYKFCNEDRTNKNRKRKYSFSIKLVDPKKKINTIKEK